MAEANDVITEGFGDLDRLDDPRLAALSRRILLGAQLAALRAVGNLADPAAFPLPERADSLERLFAGRLATFPAAQRQATVARLLPQARAARDGTPNRFGALGRLDLTATLPVSEQLRRRAGAVAAGAVAAGAVATATVPAAIGASELGQLAIGQPAFANDLGDEDPPGAAPDRADGGALPAGPARVVRNRLALRLHDVRCIGETGTWFEETFGGADEIDAAAIAIDETGGLHRRRPFHVGDFEEGQRVRYEPPNRLVTFRLDGADRWPKHEFVVLLLAEIDFGGFADFVAELYERLRDEVDRDLAALLGEQPEVGPDSHGWAERIGEALGELIGGLAAIVLPILGKLIDWIVGALGDEVFRPRLLHVTLHSPTSTFAHGRPTSSTRLVRFIGHDGEYHVRYSWERFG